MDLTLVIPDDLAGRLSASGADLSRRALEAFALEEYKNERISKAELRRLLGIPSRYELDGFLKAHGKERQKDREWNPNEDCAGKYHQPVPKPGKRPDRHHQLHMQLEQLVKGKKNIVIISSDHTRRVPSKIITPILLRRIRSALQDANIRSWSRRAFTDPQQRKS